MKKDLTELVIIIDKSGSMSGLESDVVGGFNSLIDEQIKDGGEIKVTTIFFDSFKNVVHDREDIKNITKLDDTDYCPSGCTALLDAVGSTIMHIKSIHKALGENKPSHTIFSIMTDGQENSSREFTYKKVKDLIEETKALGWDYLFQAANIDTFSECQKLGIDKADSMTFGCSSNEIRFMMGSVSAAITKKKKKPNSK